MTTLGSRVGAIGAVALLVTACAGVAGSQVQATVATASTTPATAVAAASAATPAPASSAATAASLTPAALVANGILPLQVGGVAGVPMDALAATLNVTVTNPAAAGFVTVWPCSEPRPLASNLDYVAGQSIPNLVISKLDTGGKVCLYSMVATDLVADVAGYFPAGSDYTPITNPTRILDTRNGTGAPPAKVPANGTLPLQVGGNAGVPANALAATLNVTVTNPAAAGFVTVWPCSEPRPLASNLDYVAGQSIPNLVIAKLDTGGKVCLYSMVATDLVADVAGYFPAGSDYTPITNPTRILDTRNGTGAPPAKVPANGTLPLQVGGNAGVPANALAATLNVTVTNPAAAGFVTVWPCSEPRPLASNLDYVAGQSIPNLVIAKLDTGGKVCLYSMVATDLVADVAGYFPAGSDYTPITNPTRILDTRDGTGTNPAGTPGTPGTPGSGSSVCSFSKADVPLNVALCQTFDAPAGTPSSRSGDLDYSLWGVSRIGTGINSGGTNDWAPANLQSCGATQSVLPPRDVQICNGRVIDAVNDDGGQTTLAMYPKQPFDIAGRTGTVVFDVSDDSEGIHAAWPEFWWTDQPVPAPHGELTTQSPFARNSFGFSIAGQCEGNVQYQQGDSGDYVTVDKMQMTTNYALSDVSFTQTGCVKKGSPNGALNHFEVRINANRVEVWGSDAGSSAVRMIAFADVAMPMTRGVVWLEDVHYNACKFDDQCDHTFAWDNLGFDGPTPYRDLTFDVPDASPSSLGYEVAQGEDQTVTADGVHWAQTPTTAYIGLNWFPFEATEVPSVSVNGGPAHTVAWPFDPTTYVWRTIAIPIPVGEVKAGANSITIRSGSRSVVSNINVILIAATPVP